MNDGPSHTFQIFRAGIRSPVFLAWILFLIQGFFYAAFLPPWEGFDEPIHLAYIAFLHDERKLPVLGESTISNEIQSSINSLPVSRSLDPYSTRRFETFFTVSNESGARAVWRRAEDFRVLVSSPWENFKVITDRLAMLKPHWLDAAILRAGCVVFVLAVVVVAVLPWMQVKRWNQSGEI